MSQNASKYDSWFSFRYIAAGLVSAASLAFLLLRYKKFSGTKSLVSRRNIQVVNTKDECVVAVNTIRRKVSKYKVLGFDCEWVTKNGVRYPVSLLQLSSLDGYCALFRLCKIQYVPKELKMLLEDGDILKVGVSPTDDAKYLLKDYAVQVDGILDLRYLTASLSETPTGLSAMSEMYLGVPLDKRWHIRCSDWEAPTLSESQIHYAAADAFSAVKVFKIITDKIIARNNKNKYYLTPTWNEDLWNNVTEICSSYINTKFKCGYIKYLGDASAKKFLSLEQQKGLYLNPNKPQHRNYTCQTISKIAYENCYMETPDGELLCMCNRKKAQWYAERELADVISEDPYTVRLKFEPAGRRVGDVGMFYSTPRENHCVVCGQSHSHIKKNIIPKEYRKLFPLIMKDHSSHDVLLLCANCHQLSNIRDQSLKDTLSHICNYPFGSGGNTKYLENHNLKKVKSAVKALLSEGNKHILPDDRKVELQDLIFLFHPDIEELNESSLREILNMNHSTENQNYISHGERVVEHFKKSTGGLLALERMWREHFVKTMNPQFMPYLWSIDHNKSRIEILISEGRITEEELSAIGLNTNETTSVSN